MSIRNTFAISRRILKQLRNDKRTVMLILITPSLLLVLLRYVFNNSEQFSEFAPLLAGIFPLTVMFVVTSIATLRERTYGTLERLMTLPVGKLDIVFGYALGFLFVALLQASLISFIMLNVFDVEMASGALPVIATALSSAFLGISLGLFVSAFARSEYQAVQFLPAFVMPQLLLCGLFVPREQMGFVLQGIAHVLPLSYIVEAMRTTMHQSGWDSSLMQNLAVVTTMGIVALLFGALTLRRKET